MTELIGGVVGGLGLFFFGMWLLTENLKKLASRRLRRMAQRWTANRFTALAWGALAGSITQNMTALTFIVVSFMRSGLIATRGALAIVLGGAIGIAFLVMIVTFDIRTGALFVLGLAGAAAVSERLSSFRPVSASLFGGAMLVLGLVLLKEAAAPLAEAPWFRDMMTGTGDSLVLAFLVSAALTFIVQSSGAVSVFAIGLAAVHVVSVDQALMIMYGSFFGSGAIMYVLSAGLTGRSRQIAMYHVANNSLLCVVLVPLLYAEIHLGIPSTKALILATDLDLPQQLALVIVIAAVLPMAILLPTLGVSARILERLWPTSRIDTLSRTRFIHDRATVDVETSLMLADLEQRRAFGMLSGYFDLVRKDERVEPYREASRVVLFEIDGFLSGLPVLHPLQGVEDRNALLSRQMLLYWLEDAVAEMCTALAGLAGRADLEEFRMSVCEGVDSVFLALAHAMEDGDRVDWDLAARLLGDRSALMRRTRAKYLEAVAPMRSSDSTAVIRITGAVEEIFVLVTRIAEDMDPYSDAPGRGAPQTAAAA
ncbi:MAG: Na/Pi symporter [Rhodospirillaceae bacterium]|nr:Na/Pi symporter [Rhodospirillaceae bacterium]